MLRVGESSPDFTLPSTLGENVSLSSFRGRKNVLLLFYPLDWSPVCSSEHVKCSRMFPNVSDDVQVLGISVDSIWSHNAYAKAYNIPYLLLADFQPRGAVAEKYDVYLPDLGIAARTAFVIDKKGIIRHIAQAQMPDERRIDDLLSEAQAAG
jgi:mycoredoxin-dependent peroxiredoxin